MPPAHDGTDGTSEYLIPKTSRNLSDSIASREQRQRATLSEQGFLVNLLRSSPKTLQKNLTWRKLSEIVALAHKIGVLYNEVVKVLNTYHSVATAQQLLGKLETYSQILIRLQQQAVQLTKSFGSREE